MSQVIRNIFCMYSYIYFTVLVSFQLKKAKTTPFFPASCKNFISDFAVIIAIGSMALLDYGVGVDTPKLSVPDTIRPTWEGRGWLIHPLGKRESIFKERYLIIELNIFLGSVYLLRIQNKSTLHKLHYTLVTWVLF